MPIAGDRPEVGTKAGEELERIRAFKLPNFVSPYPFKRNPFADSATEVAHRWLVEYSLDKLYDTPEEKRAVYTSNFSELAMVGYVSAGEKGAIWAAKWYIWLFVLDDYLNQITDFSSLEKTTSLFLDFNLTILWSIPDAENSKAYKLFLEFLDVTDADRTQALKYVHSKLDEARLKPGTVYDTSSPHVHPLCKAFRDLWAPFCESMPENFLSRWGPLAQEYVLGSAKEIRDRKNKTIPSMDVYIALRRETAAIWPVLGSLDYTNNVNLPDELFDSREMQAFICAASDFLGWQQDIWSFQKEILMGDVHNLVTVVSHEKDCSYVEAGTIVFQMMMDKLVDMEKTIYDLEKVTPPEYQHGIAPYIEWARQTVTGGPYWYGNCIRYTGTNE